MRNTDRRRLKQISLGALVALAAGASSAQAAVTVNLHSGGTSSASLIGTLDPKVEIKADTASTGQPPPPRQANVIAPHPYWSVIAGSEWVSNSAAGASSGVVGTTRYAVNLPVPYGATAVSLTGKVYADDQMVVRVNSGPVIAQKWPTYNPSTWAFMNAPTPFTTTSTFNTVGGTNTLTFDVGNGGGGANGLDFVADLTYTEGPPAPTQLDHFKCYTVKPTSPKQRAVILSDQFGVRKSKVREVRELCNPVRKIHGKKVFKPKHPQAHLVCRRTVDQGAVAGRAVRLRNQFGVQDTVTTGAQTLCLPSLKRKLKGSHGRPPVGANPEKVLDHFRCYGVQPRRVRIDGIGLTDQFGSGGAQILTLVKLCNPVQKTFKNKVTKIKYPAAHLACYTIKDNMKFKPLWVSTRNQFGIRKLHVKKALSLCLPTFKQLLKTGAVEVEPPVEAPTLPEPFTAGLTATQCVQGETVVHTVNGTTTPAHGFATATGVLRSSEATPGAGREQTATFPAQTVALAADGTWTAQVSTPRTPASYSWDWEVKNDKDINGISAKASIPVIVKADGARC